MLGAVIKKQKAAVLTRDEAGVLVALMATLLGGWMRLLVPASAGFPINDGGLFYAMMKAVRDSGYALPPTVHYNGLDIPFAYPPLGFYLGAGLGDLLHVSDLTVLQWLPAIVLIGTIPAFFSLAATITRSRFQAGIATLFFALIPRSITWLIMGGGLTRSLGELWLILAVQQLYLLFTDKKRKHLLLGALFCTLIVLTHPEAALHTVGIGILFWALLSPNKKGMIDAILLALAVMVLSAFWWIQVIAVHGPRPFFAASLTGMYGYVNFLRPLLLTFAEEPFMTLAAASALIGIALSLTRREILLPTWLVMHFLLELRNAANVAIIPLTILAGLGVTDVVIPALKRAREQMGVTSAQKPYATPTFGLLLFVGIYLLGSFAYSNTQLVARTVSPANREAYDWVRRNTPTDSRFLVLTGDPDFFADGVQEWFPVLADRSNVTTPQGMEWLKQKDFTSLTSQMQSIQLCLYDVDPLACITKATGEAELLYSHIYIARRPVGVPFEQANDRVPRGDALIAELNSQPEEYENIYQTDAVAVYRKVLEPGDSGTLTQTKQ